MKIVPYIALAVSLGALYLAWEAQQNEVPKIAVINIAAAIEAIPGERTPEAIEEATSKTYQQAARLPAYTAVPSNKTWQRWIAIELCGCPTWIRQTK